MSDQHRMNDCPFVDGNVHTWNVEEIGPAYQVVCSCGASGPKELHPREAISAWNRRQSVSGQQSAVQPVSREKTRGQMIVELSEYLHTTDNLEDLCRAAGISLTTEEK